MVDSELELVISLLLDISLSKPCTKVCTTKSFIVDITQSAVLTTAHGLQAAANRLRLSWIHGLRSATITREVHSDLFPFHDCIVCPRLCIMLASPCRWSILTCFHVIHNPLCFLLGVCFSNKFCLVGSKDLPILHQDHRIYFSSLPSHYQSIEQLQLEEDWETDNRYLPVQNGKYKCPPDDSFTSAQIRANANM